MYMYKAEHTSISDLCHHVIFYSFMKGTCIAKKVHQPYLNGCILAQIILRVVFKCCSYLKLHRTSNLPEHVNLVSYIN